MMMYRLLHKDGTVGAWTTNYKWILKNAKFFDAEIEAKFFEKLS